MQWLAATNGSAAPHFNDNFDSGSYGAASFNNTIASDQGGTLAGTAYSVYTPSADWQAQHGNGGAMLLVGDVGYSARASLNQNFATLANTTDMPVSFQMDAWVTDTSNNACWASITIGSGQNLLPNDAGAKFAILPELGGGLQVIINGAQQLLASRSGNNFRILLSDTAGTGSAFNGKGSKAVLYNGSVLVGTYTLPQLTGADGFLSFSACPYNGAWNITHIDNLSIRVENPATPLKWTLWTGNATWPTDRRDAIIAAMDEAVGIYNSNGHFPKNLIANYSAGVPTAQAGYSGWMDFGNSFGTRVTLHEIAHTLGCGTHWVWPYLSVNGQWNGTETSRFVKLFEGPTASIGSDSMHFWPYGLNYDNEDSAVSRVRHVKIVAAMRRDMGIVGVNEDDGVFDDDQDSLPDDWETFHFGNLNQTASGDPDLDGISNRAEYLGDQDPNANQPDFIWSNSASTDGWNTSDTNWNGMAWTNAATNNAVFSTVGGTISLAPSIVAGNVSVGSTNFNIPNTTLTSGSLNAANLTVQGYANNGSTYSSNPTLTLSVPTVSVSGDIAVGRSNLVIGSGTITANRIISAAGSADWANLVINGGTVTAANGVDGSVNTAATFQVDLNGGTLFTPYLKAADRDPSVGGARLNFNGTVIRPTANSASFITLHGGNQNAYVGDGGAIFSTDGYSIGISANLLASGNGGLTKNGSGTLTLSGNNTYTGGTTVNGGSLVLDGANGGNSRIRGALSVNAGSTVSFTNGDGTGLGWNEGAKITSLAINGGTVTSAGIIHVWNLGSNLTLTGGTLQSNNGSSDASGPQLEWTGTNITTLASANPSVIAGRVRFRPDSGTLNTIEVADGAAATDLLISAALTETSRSNLLKTGAGTLRITGSVQLTGVINVEAGTLDFAPSAVSSSLRISVADGARVNLSNAATTMVKNVYVAGQRLTSGTWGAPGSGATNVSAAFTGTGILQVTDTEISNRERWKRMKYGQFTHYVWDGAGLVTRLPDGSNSPSIDYVANNFDAIKYANDLQSMGVEYVIFTAWHANFNPLFNSSTFDRYGYSYRRSQRDMLGDMITAVRAKGIRVLFYTHPNQPISFDWTTHNNMINDIYAEMIDRYGDQIDGFYMDENDPGGNQNSSVDFVRLGQTIHRRNPDMMLIQNFYGNLYCNSVPMGESGPASANFSKDVSWPSTSSYAQVMSNSWSAQVPVTQYAATRSAEGIFRGAVTAACSSTDGGGWAWASGPFPGGQWEQGVLETMQAAGALIAPVAESIKNTYPSTSFSFSGTWGGATRSPDDTKEYLHVLWPPSGNTLTLPAPADGKIFANARLLANGQPVTLAQNSRAVRLTLNGTNTWDANDTVIVIDVVSAGDPYLANNTTPDATYTGAWVYSGNRATSEFGRDVHTTTVNGDFVEYNFNGTDIELVVSCGPNRGTLDIYIDGVFKQTANATDSNDGLRKTIYHGSGLTRGNHTLKVVKTGGSYLAIDAFRATELIDSADPDVGYQAMSFFNNTDTTPNAIGYIEYDWNWQWQQRDRNEYNYDAHWAQANGSTFWIHFNGTGVQFIGTHDGIIDFYLDDVFVKQVNMRSIGGLARVVGLDIKGLPAGNHVLKGVKAGDTYALVDAFFVYNGQNSSWSTQTDSTANGGSYRRSSGLSDAATLRFHGTGIEVLAPHGPSGGTVAATIQSAAYQDYVWQVVNQYAADNGPQSRSFASRNVTLLPEGDYTLALSHNRSFGSIALDALRVYKNRPGSGPALQWGSAGGGGSGTWDVNTTSNWWDGANATPWYDFGASDYTAIFGGGSGVVSLASTANINRLTFNTTGYTLQNGTLNFNGIKPTVTLASNVATTIASGIVGTSGLTKDGTGTLTLTGNNSGSGEFAINSGALVAARSIQDHGIHTLGNGPLVINNGGTLRTTQNWATSSYWTSTSVGAITVNQGGTWSIEAVGMTVRYGLNLNGGSLVGTAANTDWGALHLMSDVVAGGNAVSSVGVDTALSGTRIFTVGSGSQLNYSGALHSQYGTTGALIKTGAGTMVLSGTNTYGGATTVNEGVLSVTGSVQSTSSVTIAAGAQLQASGTLQTSGSVTNSGTLVFSGSAVFSAGGTITNYGTIINSSPSLVLPGNIVNYGTILTLPPAPTGLTATPSGTSAALAWSTVSGATSYKVKQATSASGPFTLIGTPTTNAFTTGSLSAGTTYHFVVSAVNSLGEGANSATASCVIGTLPLPWVTADIGAVGLTGSATALSGIYTVKGSGTGVYASTDQFRMAYQTSSGDCQLIARVDSLTNPSVSAKAGVMIRESLATNARCAGVYVTPSSGVQFIWRTTAGSMVNIATVSGLTAPRWVRIQRVGNTFKAYHSPNGSTWTQFGGNKTISMATSAYLGQAVTSGTNSSLCTGVFSSVTATP